MLKIKLHGDSALALISFLRSQKHDIMNDVGGFGVLKPVYWDVIDEFDSENPSAQRSLLTPEEKRKLREGWQ